MIFSRHNIFSKIKDSENYFIVNLLSGNADIVSPDEAEKIELLMQGSLVDQKFMNSMTEKGYWIDEQAETRLYRNKYLEFVDSRGNDETQLFFVPNYTCNFACSYCYQDEYAPAKSDLTYELIDAFFAYITKEFAGKKKYITLFGGEPLLNSPEQKELIGYFIDKSIEQDLELCIVTNGYTINEYMHILRKARIREIQITLDGTSEIHNKRRMLKNGQSTFDRIVEGIDACLSVNININLRMVIDKENLQNLPELARFAINKGWTKNAFFKTQIGRNYELHHCQSASDKLYSRVSLYEELYTIIRQHNYITDFYKPAFSVSKFLAENGDLPDPLFDSCPACKTEWAFDYTGQIYPCTATVGKADESLGTFHPQVQLNSQQTYEWEKRDVLSIPQCKECNLQLACGGGCGSVAKNKAGSICSADCRPVKELLELGLSTYGEV